VDESKIPAAASGRVESSFDGQVLENFHAENVVITHDNVTLRNFRVTRADPEAWFAIVMLKNAAGESPRGTVIKDGEITSRNASGAFQPSSAIGINGSFFLAQRLDISYMGDAGVAGREFVVEDSFIHHMIRYRDVHNDGIEMMKGSNTVVRHNTILLPNQQTSTILLLTNAGPINNVLIQNNYLNGGAFTIYSRDQGHGPPTNVTVRGNSFGRDYLYGILSDDGPVTWENNIWADTGAPQNG
jgi:hypothetical protein